MSEMKERRRKKKRKRKVKMVRDTSEICFGLGYDL
jgi:hypothetical protein